MTDTRDTMRALGCTLIAGVLGTYEALQGECHDLEIEALRLRNEGESLGSARALTVRQALNDCHRRLHVYAQLALEVEFIAADGKAAS